MKTKIILSLLFCAFLMQPLHGFTVDEYFINTNSNKQDNGKFEFVYNYSNLTNLTDTYVTKFASSVIEIMHDARFTNYTDFGVLMPKIEDFANRCLNSDDYKNLYYNCMMLKLNSKLTQAWYCAVLDLNTRFKYALVDKQFQITTFDLPEFRNSVIKEVTSAIIQYRIQNRKPIITKNGVNPLSADIDKVVAALNAPLFNGIESALSVYGINIDNLDSYRAELSANQSKYLSNIYKDQNSRDCLCIILGIAEYNALVKDLNGDK